VVVLRRQPEWRYNVTTVRSDQLSLGVIFSGARLPGTDDHG
jgi:hypothetical protein